MLVRGRRSARGPEVSGIAPYLEPGVSTSLTISVRVVDALAPGSSGIILGRDLPTRWESTWAKVTLWRPAGKFDAGRMVSPRLNADFAWWRPYTSGHYDFDMHFAGESVGRRAGVFALPDPRGAACAWPTCTRATGCGRGWRMNSDRRSGARRSIVNRNLVQATQIEKRMNVSDPGADRCRGCLQPGVRLC